MRACLFLSEVRRVCSPAVFFAALVIPVVGVAQTATRVAPHPLIVNAVGAVPPPSPAAFTEGSHIAPDGRSLTLNNRYLMLDGKPWLPVMGEFHYSRVPQKLWNQELLKMKAAGVNIVSTYVIWIHQEEIEGKFDWSGRRNLRRFIELCANNRLYVQLRIGPWVHAEVRNGGFPNWIMKKVPKDDLRKDVPEFMKYVKTFYDQIGLQVEGLLWKNGGPIIGIQLDNEYSMRGPHAGDGYILALKKLAIQAGLDVPLYVVTGWDGAVVPKGAVLPVYGGYMDAPWDGSRKQLPPNEVYAFRFGSRVSGNIEMPEQSKSGSSIDALTSNAATPFLTAEMGGGIEDTYHRRPIIRPNDVAAMYPVMLGSGVNMYGTYMFQGGENPQGKLTTLQESQVTGYPNDLPVKSYDFQAPLGEFGQERESLRKIKIFNYFMNEFGSQLAPLVVRPPEIRPKGPADLSVPRLSVRTNGREGFLFWNNYVRYYPLPDWDSVQVAVKLPHEELQIPERPITVPSGDYFIWPFNFDMSGVQLKYSTAQLFTRIKAGLETIYFFVAIPGIAPQFAFDSGTFSSITLLSGRDSNGGSTRFVTGMETGLRPAIILHSQSGSEVKLVLLSEKEAESAWRVKIGGSVHLLFTQSAFYSDRSHFYLQSVGSPEFKFRLYPEVPGILHGSSAIRTEMQSDSIKLFVSKLPAARLRFQYTKLQNAGHVPPVKLGPWVAWRKNHRVAEAPPDSEYNLAAKWSVSLPRECPPDLSELFLDTRYYGDVARLYSHGKLLEDNFYNGTTWKVGVKRFENDLRAGPLQLEILPLRKDAPIFLEKGCWPEFPASGQVAELESLTLTPEYRLIVDK